MPKVRKKKLRRDKPTRAGGRLPADTGLPGLTAGPVLGYSRKLGLYVLFERGRAGAFWKVYRADTGRVLGTYFPGSGRVGAATSNDTVPAADWRQALDLLADAAIS